MEVSRTGDGKGSSRWVSFGLGAILGLMARFAWPWDSSLGASQPPPPVQGSTRNPRPNISSTSASPLKRRRDTSPGTIQPPSGRPIVSDNGKEREAALAERLMEEFVVASEYDTSPEERLRIYSQIDDITEDLASYYVKALEASSQSTNGPVQISQAWSRAALELALLSGGDVVADYVRRILSDPQASGVMLDNLKLALGGVSGHLGNADRIPVDEELYHIARELVASPVALDRKAGVGLLSARAGPETRTTLVSLLAGETDRSVRTAAWLSLAKVGNAETLDYLTGELRSVSQSGIADKAYYEGWLKASISILESKLNTDSGLPR